MKDELGMKAILGKKLSNYEYVFKTTIDGGLPAEGVRHEQDTGIGRNQERRIYSHV
jgi:hypothetical protein